MTIVRLGQAAFDPRFRGEYIVEELGTPLDVFNASGFTGTYGFDADLDSGGAGVGFTPVSQLRAGYWLKHTNVSINSSSYVSLWRVRLDNTTNAHSVRWYGDDDKLSLYINNVEVETICASSVKINKNNHWLHIGLHAKSGASGFLSFYLNGLQIFNYTGDLGNDFIAVFSAMNDNANGNWQGTVVDDFYVDSTVSEVDGPAPAIRLYPSLPVGSGTDFQWVAVGEVATYQCVQNAPLLESELALAELVDQRDTHLMTNVSNLNGQKVHAVIPYVICRKTNPSTDSKILVHLFDGVTYQESAEFQPGVGFSYFWDRQETQPDASAWNETDANLIEMGYKSRGTF